jgi:uncharacterized HhH-GPD family protein
MKIQLLNFELAGKFEWRWPEGIEHFTRSWRGQVAIDGSIVEFRHALGQRHVYGRSRVHSVTWIAGEPKVEGVETDDYSLLRSLFSLLRQPDKRHARSDEDVPEVYSGFHIVQCRNEIEARYAPRSLGVKIAEDNVAAWATHGAIRATALRGVPKRQARKPRPAEEPASPVPEVDPTKIAGALLEFSRGKKPPSDKAKFEPTGEPPADEFVAQNALAFLFAVIADQSIPAERAWRAPYELRRRLGHLHPTRIILEPDAVAAAVKDAPAIHRFPDKYSRWIVAAARHVVDRYGGDASRIWNGGVTAREVHERLDEFSGIGQKKAAMAVQILERDLRVPIKEMQGGDVAYDIHVRRVFLRTGLAQRDELDHIVTVARRLHPERPGELDQPAWLIGRQWCRAGTPACPTCPLIKVCPKIVFRTARGA